MRHLVVLEPVQIFHTLLIRKVYPGLLVSVKLACILVEAPLPAKFLVQPVPLLIPFLPDNALPVKSPDANMWPFRPHLPHTKRSERPFLGFAGVRILDPQLNVVLLLLVCPGHHHAIPTSESVRDNP